ncbi:MAG: HAD-IIB family hydrolase [Rhodobacteraceae bacterium]|nr:HAD-IIB family hydrolase [Paracoccaceae bacterium]
MTPQSHAGMLPIEHLTGAVCRNLVGILTDIDDTITTDGRLPAAAYSMLERLSDAGLLVVPVTGRPAGWCDMIARLWPIAGIVGENGAFAMRYDHERREMRHLRNLDGPARKANRDRLTKLAETILKAVPGTALASDQQYREADLAIDFCEDVPALGDADIQRIVDHFHAAGAVAKVSSIHVNGWFGNWDKLTMSKRFMSQEFGIDLEARKDRFVYCGDSPNDAPMFGFFPNACGVANVADFLDKMEALPTFIAKSHGGEGFVEIGERILQARAGV